MFTVALAVDVSVISENNPGVAYVEIDTNLRNKIDFSKIDVLAMRVVITAQGNNAAAGKGIEIYDVTGTQALCEVIWDGTAWQYGLAGSWTNTNIPTVDSVITARVKGAVATEDFDIHVISFQILYY